MLKSFSLSSIATPLALCFIMLLSACASKMGAPASTSESSPSSVISTKPSQDTPSSTNSSSSSSSSSAATPTNKTEAATAPSKTAQVMTGDFECTGGKKLTMLRDEKQPEQYLVRYYNQAKAYIMKQVATVSGAWRFEDKANGVVLLQLANKSMLFDEKKGKIVDNDCKNLAQKTYDKSPEQEAANRRLSN